MQAPGRVAAAIDVLAEVLERHRPVAQALADWGRAHRFAGSADRAAIGNLCYDVLRRRALAEARMGDGSARALVLAELRDGRGLDVAAIEATCAARFGPGPLSEAERARLGGPPPAGLAPHVAGSYPAWLAPSFERAFGARAAAHGEALARRAPLDLRVNTLKTTRDRVLAALAKVHAAPGPWSPHAVRIAAPQGDGRTPDVEAEPAHGRGQFEVQDAGSQVAALLAGARPGEQVVDLCAGAGGKTLALAAAMANKGQIHAWDADRHRLRPIIERLQRAGVRNVQVIPADEGARLDALAGRADLVFVDAPCSGSGAWRRKPDTKWRLTPQALAARLAAQRDVLARAAHLVRPGGRIAYVTCSLLPEENADQVAAFLAAHPGFRLVPVADAWRAAIGGDMPASSGPDDGTLLLTPLDHATDGFFVAILERDGTAGLHPASTQE